MRRGSLTFLGPLSVPGEKSASSFVSIRVWCLPRPSDCVQSELTCRADMWDNPHKPSFHTHKHPHTHTHRSLDDQQIPSSAGTNRSFHDLFSKMVNYSTRGWNIISSALSFVTERFCFTEPRIRRLIRLPQEKSPSVLTLVGCFLLVWSTKKTAGSCILDTGGLDNELPVWCCQKSFGSLVKRGACYISRAKSRLLHKIFFTTRW